VADRFEPARREVLLTWPTRVGYRLHPARVVLPGTVPDDTPWNLLVEITNAGTGPFLSRWHRLQARFTTSSGAVYTEDLPVDPTQLTPGAVRTAVRCGLQLPAGDYRVALGLSPVAEIPETVPAFLSLADCAATPDGATWCPVGTLTVTPNDPD
jgi:hypothetical protein